MNLSSIKVLKLLFSCLFFIIGVIYLYNGLFELNKIELKKEISLLKKQDLSNTKIKLADNEVIKNTDFLKKMN